MNNEYSGNWFESASRLYTVEELFDGSRFRIPDYQRGYAWEKDQLNDFWEDLLNIRTLSSLEDQRHGGLTFASHYTGMLAMQAADGIANGVNGTRCFYVIDGQQRLTTIVILLHALLLTAKEKRLTTLGGLDLNEIQRKYLFDGDELQLDYKSDKESSSFLRSLLKFEGGNQEIKTTYLRNLQEASKFFKIKLNVPGVDIESVFVKTARHLLFNVFINNEEFDVNVTFETMNNRGKKLSSLELLKNRLLYLSTFFINGQALREVINTAWGKIYAQLGKNAEYAPLSDDDFLKAHKNIYFGYSRKRGDDFIKYLLDRYFVVSRIENAANIQVPEEDGVKLELAEVCDDGEEDSVEEEDIKLTKGLAASTEGPLSLELIKEYVNDLARFSGFWVATYFPATCFSEEGMQSAISRINHVRPGYFRPIVAAILSRKEDNDCSKIIECLNKIERFVFLNFRFGNARSSYRSSAFFRETGNLYRRSIRLDALLNSALWKSDDATRLKEFKIKINDCFKNRGGYYSWDGIQHFLYEYESYLGRKGETKGILIGWDDFTKLPKDRISIEHIYPQTSTDESWCYQFQQFPPDERRQLRGLLGNLIPLPQAKNAEVQNAAFSRKATQYRQFKYYSALDVCERGGDEKWTPKMIVDRSKEMIEFVFEHWNIDPWKDGEEEKNSSIEELSRLNLLRGKKEENLMDLTEAECKQMIEDDSKFKPSDDDQDQDGKKGSTKGAATIKKKDTQIGKAEKREIALAFVKWPEHYPQNKDNINDSHLCCFKPVNVLISVKCVANKKIFPCIGFYFGKNKQQFLDNLRTIQLPEGFYLDEKSVSTKKSGWVPFCKKDCESSRTMYEQLVLPGTEKDSWINLFKALIEQGRKIFKCDEEYYEREIGWAE